MPAVSATVVAVFVLVHLFVGKLRFLDGVPRSRWLSMAGGIVLNVLKEELNARAASCPSPAASPATPRC